MVGQYEIPIAQRRLKTHAMHKRAKEIIDKHTVDAGCSEPFGPGALLLFELPEQRRLGQRKHHNFFARERADVMVQANRLDSSDILDERFQHRPGRFDQLDAHLFEQVSALPGRKCLDEMLFCRGQNTVEADHQQVAEQVSMNVFWTTAHVLLLESRYPFANSGFDFSLGFHCDLRT